MKLWNYLDVDKLEQHIAAKLVDCRYHKDFQNLMILSYGRRAVYENLWDDVTTRCRGLIVDFATGDIIARPFEKFFNIDTDGIAETQPFFLRLQGPPIVDEKLDGSLGTLYSYQGAHAVASKGSFHSEHAEWATKWYREHVPDPRWPEGYTPVVEMICESVQHHVVHYGWEGLVLTALIHKETGSEKNIYDLEYWGRQNGIKTVRHFKIGMEDAVAANWPNQEGFVLVWPRPGQTPLRVKVKTAEFLRLQKIMHSISPRHVFEYLRDTGSVPQEWLDTMPHVAEAVNKWQDKLRGEYRRIQCEAARIMTIALQECTTRKECALYLNQAENKPYAAVCFALLDEKDYRKPIWKMVATLVDGKPMVSDEEEIEQEDLSSRADQRPDLRRSAGLEELLQPKDQPTDSVLLATQG